MGTAKRATLPGISRLLLPCLALALLRTPSLLSAGSDPSGAGRLPRVPADPAMEPLLSALELRTPDYEAVEATALQPPLKTISLGLSTKLYQCWKLRLLGGHGLQASAVMERLKSLQTAMKNERTELLKDLASYAAARKPDPSSRARIEARAGILSDLLSAYRSAEEAGLRNGLIEAARGWFGGGVKVTPLLSEKDYVMTYDDSVPQCPSEKPR